MPLKLRHLTKEELHILMGYPSKEAIDQLAENVIGLTIAGSTVPRTIDCEQCIQNKAY